MPSVQFMRVEGMSTPLTFFNRKGSVHALSPDDTIHETLRRGFNRQGQFPPVTYAPHNEAYVLIPRKLTLEVPRNGRRARVMFPEGNEHEEMPRVCELELANDTIYVVGSQKDGAFKIEGALLYINGDLGTHAQQPQPALRR